ncbi:MAG TPA: putative Ig domain-containing protein [Burkholderiaceae bacterium]|nr:putative Ig domain-containing protein [Burkholderiaceae bacterium]
MNRLAPARKANPALALSAVLLASLAACGGGASPETQAQSAAAPDAATTASQTGADTGALDSGVAAALAAAAVQPSYHMAPALLDEPSDADAGGTNSSALSAPKTFTVDADAADLDTARLSRDTLIQHIAERARARAAAASGETTTPLTTSITGRVFTPAQIRAAYGLSALPAAGATLTAAQKAALGAGQTIYLVDAYHDSTALSDLNAFSAKFGLPACTKVSITSNAKLATPPSNCTFAQVYSATGGAVTATAPAYNATWAPESKLDVQWAHAIAPLARIVLIEMPSAMSNAILYANSLATKLGPGVVSMSFGATEASWASTVDSYFAGTGMTFVAAAGDSGAQVLWPAVSPKVLAVGGTSTNVSTTGSRIEVAWAGTGGGMSAYMALPSWQSGVTPAGGSALARRAVPDVAFNASPMTGEYVAVTLPGASTVWSAYGGTSIAAPQWAGLVAVANAIRAASSKAALGDVHTALYKSIAAVPGTYAASLHDVVEGTNGTCATCRAGTGYDQATGWGSPNASQLFQALAGASTTTAATTTGTSTNTAPTVTAATLSEKAGAYFATRVAARDADGDALSYTMSGAPSGLTLAGNMLSGTVSTKGTYRVTVTAHDTHGATGSAVITLVVA